MNSVKKLAPYLFGFICSPVCNGSLFLVSVDAIAHEGTLDKVYNNQVLSVATNPDYEPFEYIERENVVGYGPDLLEKILAGSGITVERANVPFAAVISSLLAKKVDMAATALTITPERATKVAFTRPIAVTEWVVVSRKNEQYDNMRSLLGKRIGVQQNSAAAKHLAKVNNELQSEHQKGFGELVSYLAYPELQLALISKRIDALLMPMPMASLWVKNKPDAFQISFVDKSAGRTLSAWAVRGNDSDLRDYINKRLEEIRQNGEMESLQQKWFGMAFDTPDHDYLPEGHL